MDTIYDFSSVGHQICVFRFYLLVLEPYSLSSSDRNTVTIRRYSLATISKKYHWMPHCPWVIIFYSLFTTWWSHEPLTIVRHSEFSKKRKSISNRPCGNCISSPNEVISNHPFFDLIIKPHGTRISQKISRIEKNLSKSLENHEILASRAHKMSITSFLI